MIFARQRHLMALLDVVGGEMEKLDFQKLLFLYCQELADPAPYDFVPHHFGGFSFTSHADKRRLADQGMLANDEHRWKLTIAGRAQARLPAATRENLNRFARRHRGLRGDPLVAEAYRRHPYYATRSEIVDRVLPGDTAAQKAIQQAKPKRKHGGLCTIGYEGHSLESYLNLLIRDGVTLLCDVRRNPLSRKFGFSKGILSETCSRIGIRYEHLPTLGIPSEARRDLSAPHAREILFADYRNSTLPRQTAALAKIETWRESGERIALTCYEHMASDCHRHCVAEALAPRTRNATVIRNL